MINGESRVGAHALTTVAIRLPTSFCRTVIRRDQVVFDGKVDPMNPEFTGRHSLPEEGNPTLPLSVVSQFSSASLVTDRTAL